MTDPAKISFEERLTGFEDDDSLLAEARSIDADGPPDGFGVDDWSDDDDAGAEASAQAGALAWIDGE